jgi:hypothetical protein
MPLFGAAREFLVALHDLVAFALNFFLIVFAHSSLPVASEAAPLLSWPPCEAAIQEKKFHSPEF